MNSLRTSSIFASIIKDSRIANSDFSSCGFNLEWGSCAFKFDHSLVRLPKIDEFMVLESLGDGESIRCSCQILVNENLHNQTLELLWT